MKSSIKTRYNDILFRSKLEADWARLFDALGVKWEYEREGRYFGDVFYLPDFWLPMSRQYVEVKGEFEPADCKKIHAVTDVVGQRPHTHDENCPDIVIVACEPNGVFRGWERDKQGPVDWVTFLTQKSRHVALFECNVCKGWWFLVPELSWRCQCCGAYDGDGHLSDMWESPIPGFPDLSRIRAHRDLPEAI